ncbi:hypothetical protein GCM10011514_19240 [Emticicia aquatilis]|uniref:Uncharacterized protein n=1 Tax=Emticicia aquatilis TaxID=1537369 RepID=A0A916YPI3_9BACT|nr:hypothetical protein [Emticicia aquatilis]GGD55208.1 hypothetical protein GCM10011514_19240 [Emticicia aquatilis]
MTIVIKSNSKNTDVDLLLKKLKESPKKQGLRKHFGLLKRNIDGLELQKELRNEWD